MEKDASVDDFPQDLLPELMESLKRLGIYALYSHQKTAWKEINDGKNIVICTGTASGKTLCYNLPVLHALLKEIKLCALYLFPSKALTYDQKDSLGNLLSHAIWGVYDGDTPSARRGAIRKETRIVLSNPDMLHSAILPHHTLWANFFSNLRFVVLDEIHLYRGIFGSHIANLIRRLKRIACFYGCFPQFILTSATIANAQELAQNLIEEKVNIVSNDGSPHGKKNFLLYNPPIVQPELGIRRSSLAEAVRFSRQIFEHNIQAIIFTRSRHNVEMILRHLHKVYPLASKKIKGYRSGYLPKERREIEKGLRSGEVKLVVATNALELGIDIGGMDAVLLVGYPGTIAATRQQAGRAGRREKDSLAILIASSSPLDQFLAHHPEYLLERSPEKALINPNNPLILLQHIRCAAFELPFQSGAGIGKIPWETVEAFLEILQDEGFVIKSGNRLFWVGGQYPAGQVSLRSTGAQDFVIQVEDETGRQEVIGEVDEPSVSWMLHPQAIYLHGGKTYKVKKLISEEKRAILSHAETDYYTQPIQESQAEKLSIEKNSPIQGGNKFFGEILVTSRVVGFAKKRWFTQELLEKEELDLPSSQLRTTAYWFSLNEETVYTLRTENNWRSDPNYYGPNWDTQKKLARQRDSYLCQKCGIAEKDKAHHVHHKVPFRLFTSLEKANAIENLITLCPRCHRQAEAIARIHSGLSSVSYVLCQLAPLFLMCDSSDLGTHTDPQSKWEEEKAIIVLYDRIPGGLGLSDTLYEIHDNLLKEAYEVVESCPCIDGCPSCVGPGGEKGQGGKKEALALLALLYCERP